MPLYRRVPKFGFKPFNRVEYIGINLDRLQTLAESKGLTTITIETLVSNGMVGKKDLVKILGRGEIKSSLNVSAHAFSESAQKAIEAVGGSAVKL
jgi:large subunit ribosomal protein L15